MSSSPQSTLALRISGKWQVPLLCLALPTFICTVLWLRPAPILPDLGGQISFIRSMKTSLLLPEAARRARDLLADERYPQQQLAPVHAMLAEVLFDQEQRRTVHEPSGLVGILAIYAQAEVLGYECTGEDLVRQGQVLEWLHRDAAAEEHYVRALRHAPDDPLEVRRRLLSLHGQRVPADASWLLDELTALIRDASGRPRVQAWALEHKLQHLLDQNREAEAEAMLAEHRSTLSGTDQELFLDYLTALLEYQTGRHQQAELTLRNLRGKHSGLDDLHARSGWLLGRVVLQDDGPQRPIEAMTFFEEVMAAHPQSPYAQAARLGKAEALSLLQRFDEALEDYRDLVPKLRASTGAGPVDRGAVLASLTVLARRQFDDQHLDSAVSYLQLATDLVDPGQVDRRADYLRDLADMKSAVAEHQRALARAAMPDERQLLQQRSSELLLSAGRDQLELAHLRPADEDFSSEATWRAAVLFDSGGDRGQAITMLEEFLAQRPDSTYRPLVLQRLGQAQQAAGMFPQAITHYQTLIREQPRHPAAQDAVIPLADCFIMLGADYADEAEHTLRYILEEPPGQPAMFTPNSMKYRDALFRLGELYSRLERYEEAIVRLDEALQRYPDDPRLLRGTFLLAEAYRKSGLALDVLSEDIGNTARRLEVQRRKQLRLQEAEGLFGRVTDRLSASGVELDDVQRLQLMLSYLYRADCAFDVGDLDVALQRYQEVIRLYSDQPIALSAYVQQVHCLEGLGRTAELLPALRRAQHLVTRIDAARFDEGLTSRTPAQWQRLFTWLEGTVPRGRPAGGALAVAPQPAS